eukprot:1346000-Prymnesium_polylepis.2
MFRIFFTSMATLLVASLSLASCSRISSKTTSSVCSSDSAELNFLFRGSFSAPSSAVPCPSPDPASLVSAASAGAAAGDSDGVGSAVTDSSAAG